MRLRKRLWQRRRYAFFAMDAVCIALSYWLSFAIGLPNFSQSFGKVFVSTLPLVIACRLLFLWLFKLHRTTWRYASITDLENILKAVAASQAVVIVLLVFITRLKGYPRRIFVIDALLLMTLLGATRFGYRILRNRERGRKPGGQLPRSLIVGAGDAGETILRNLKFGNHQSGVVVGFLDDDPAKAGLRIHGVPVLDKIGNLPSVIERREIDEVIVAIPSATRFLKRQIFAACARTHVRVKTVPNLHDVITGRRQIAELNDLDPEHLLGRESITTNVEEASGYLLGKRVLVTGAGGSIGGEICEQVLAFGPESLILVGKGENSLHDVRLRLVRKRSPARIHCILGSVTNKRKMARVFDRFRPQVVFHAAAHKHVDLTEMNCDEAVLNNVLGTRNILDVSEEYSVERIVVISTDKAADPTTIMGCTKRIVEMLVGSRKESRTVAIGVRFCNVLDSKGSVIPTFRRQIQLGGPVTVTDKKMKRYFMTIPEAVELVIQAGAIGRHGEILMLDMGDPVRVLDLAKQMIRLAGHVEGKDMHIEFTGPRPGEKLEEQLVGQNESLDDTEHPKIRRIVFEHNCPDRKVLNGDIDFLIEKSILVDLDSVRGKLREMVPEYNPRAGQGTKARLPEGERYTKQQSQEGVRTRD